MKLELILRLLDNDELSPEQVNDVKDFLEDYVERNQVTSTRRSIFHMIILMLTKERLHMWQQIIFIY